MNPSYVLLLAFLIGVIGGLRTMTAPAVVAWAANRHWLSLDDSPLALTRLILDCSFQKEYKDCRGKTNGAAERVRSG